MRAEKAKTDRRAPEITSAGLAATLERDETDEHKDWRYGGDIEGQYLHDKRGADIGSKHDGERGHESMSPLAMNEVTISPVAVLLCKRDVIPRPARNAFQRFRRPTPSA